MATQGQAQAPAAATGGDELQEVTVTGSRVIANGNDAPTPVTVVNVQDLLTMRPTTVFENLSALPVFSGSSAAQEDPQDVVTSGGNGVVGLNMRNLGGLRSLVLYDGHRVPPTTADGFVDVNMLPQMLLQRVDVVTGGASAVYGSDAVSGVINFITDTKFNGVKVNLQRGISTYNDDPSYEVGVAFGQQLFGGRGHIEASYQRHEDSGIPFRLQSGRSWATDHLWTLQGDGSAAFPWHLQDNVHSVALTFGGRIVCPSQGYSFPCSGTQSANGSRYIGSLVGYTFDDNGVLTPFQAGASGAAAGLTQGSVQIGGDGGYHASPGMKSASQLDQFFGRFDYDLTDTTRGYITVSSAIDRLDGGPASLRSFGQGWLIGACNAFLSAQYQTAFGCTNANRGTASEPVFRFSKIFNALVEQGDPRGDTLNYTHTYFINAGLEGKFGNGYSWEASLTNSQARLNTRTTKLHHQGQLDASLDSVVDPSSGQIVCNVTLTNPGLYPGCVPLNPFGPSAASAAAVNYIFTGIEHTATNRLTGASGSVKGEPFSTWAGSVDTALSGEVRRQTYSLTSSSLPDDFVNCTGLRFGNCTATTTEWLHGYAPRSPVTQTAEEGAVEFNVPLLKDHFLAKDVNFNAAGRYTRYDNNPNDPTLEARKINAITWKAGLVWALNDQLTLRWARSRDIRAPNLYDLYSPLAVNANTLTIDYLQPGTPIINPTGVSGGNPDLKPEVAHTTTIGLVWRPISGLSFAVDGYMIKIVDALASINGGAQAVQQACYLSGGTSSVCSLQVRPFGCCSNTTSANPITTIYSRQVNIAVQKASGIDFESNYNTRLFDHGFSLRTLVTYQPHLIYQQILLPTEDQAGVSYNADYGLLPTPVWKATLFLHYEVINGFSVDVQERYRSGLALTANPDPAFSHTVGGVSSVAYTALNLGYTIPSNFGQFNVYLNIQNLFNKDPPVAADPAQQFQPGLTSNGYAFGDDEVGRYYSVGLRARF